jgi:2-oxoglutarate ferredoxin oxidoreductase subunit alpha
MPPSKFRDDITVVGVPLTAMCNEKYQLPRERQLFKNIVYVGALAALLGIDPAVIEQLLAEQFAGRAKLIAANVEALHMGVDYVRQNLEPLGLQVRSADKVGDRIFVEGNAAAAPGRVYGGATVCAWYPITPSTSLAEAFTGYCEDLRTSLRPARRATPSSRPRTRSPRSASWSAPAGTAAAPSPRPPARHLADDRVHRLSYFAEIPAVIFDVQRGGPSTGMPTRTQQADLIGAAYAGHGDTKHPMLLPADPGECFEMGALAFDLADRLQTTVFVMLDLDIGMNEWLTSPSTGTTAASSTRGKVLTYEELEAGVDFGRYLDVDGDGIPTAPIRASHPPRAATSPAAPRATPTPATRRRARSTSTTCSACCASSRRAKALMPAPVVGRQAQDPATA